MESPFWELNEQIAELTKERNDALDALTVTQEEWFLRVKNLEIENYDLKQKLKAKEEAFWFAIDKLLKMGIKMGVDIGSEDELNALHDASDAVSRWNAYRPKK